MKHLLISLVLVAAAGCESSAKEAPLAPEAPAIHVQTVDVTDKLMPNELPLTGQLVANQQSDVAANGLGRVVKTLVDRGTYVKEGSPLVQLDTKTAQLTEAEARANLQTAEASEDLAQTLCKRTNELYQRQAISKEEWERTSSQCKTSAASVEAARARAEQAAKTLSDATVRAPFSGMVGDRFVSVGEYVMPATRVVTLVELDPLRLQLTVPEADIGHVQEDQEVRFTVEAYPDRTFTGKMKYLDPTVRANTRDLVAEAVVPNPDHALKPGMFAIARLVLPDKNVPTVPKEALVKEGASTRLFVVSNAHVEERIVQPGAERGGSVAILEGAKAGDKAISPVSDAVRDGVPVN